MNRRQENGMPRETDMSLPVGRPIELYWFSGSGNTLVIAREIERNLSGKGYTVSLVPMEKSDPAKADRNGVIGLAVPVAGQGTYPFIWEFISGLPRGDNTPCFLADTLGMYSGGIVGPVKIIMKRKGYLPLGAMEFPMPNIFQKREAGPDAERRLIDEAKASVDAFCDSLVLGRGRWKDIPVYSDFISIFYRYRPLVALWKRLFPLRFDGDKCVRCGTCARLCPQRCIHLDGNGGPPARSSECVLCQRCFAFCPSHAITIGNGESVQYAAVSLADLTRSLDMRGPASDIQRSE